MAVDYQDSPDTTTDDTDATDITPYLQAIDRYDRGTETWRIQCEKINKLYLDQDRSITAPRRFALLWSNIETLKPAVYARLPVAIVSRRFKDDDPIGRRAGEVLERCINSTFDLYEVDEVLQLVRDDRLLTARGTAWVRYEAEFEGSAEDSDYSGDSDSPQGSADADDGASGAGGSSYRASPRDTGRIGAPSQRSTEPGAARGATPPSGAAESFPARAASGPGKLKSEYVCVEFVHWSDFGHTLNRTWPEVTKVWRRVYMTRDKITKRWDKDTADKLNYSVRPEYTQRYGPEIKDASEPQAIVYEIWCKEDRQVYWIAKDEKILLEKGDPPLNFRNFFPCPKPAYGTRSTGSLIPTPDYRYYQDQAEEINELTVKIDALQKWLKLKAFIPAGPSSEGSDAIRVMLQELTQKFDDLGIFVPVESWTGWTEKGGSRMVDWLPMDMVMQTIETAIKVREQLIQDVYQITGISDILRGETDPNETLGAQEIKAQTGSRRIQTCQRDLARFARDLAELVGEVISEYFSPETIAEMSGMDLTTEPPPEMLLMARQLVMQVQQPPPQPQLAPPGVPGSAPPAQPPAPQPDPQAMQKLQAIQAQFQQMQQNKAILDLLRDEKTRNFRIEIETDSTIEPNESAEKQRRVEFLQSTGQFFQQSLPVLQMMPTAAPLVGQMLLFMVRGFRAGRELEDTIEQTMQQVMAQAMQPKPDPNSAELDLKKQELQLKAQDMQQTAQFKQAELQQVAARDAQDLQMRQAEHQLKQGDQQQIIAQRQQEMAQSAAQHQQEMLQAAEKHRQEVAMAALSGDQELTQNRAKYEQEMAQAQEAHAHKIAESKINIAAKTHEAAAHEAASKPRSMRVVRDANGRVVGAEEVRH